MSRNRLIDLLCNTLVPVSITDEMNERVIIDTSAFSSPVARPPTVSVDDEKATVAAALACCDASASSESPLIWNSASERFLGNMAAVVEEVLDGFAMMSKPKRSDVDLPSWLFINLTNSFQRSILGEMDKSSIHNVKSSLFGVFERWNDTRNAIPPSSLQASNADRIDLWCTVCHQLFHDELCVSDASLRDAWAAFVRRKLPKKKGFVIPPASRFSGDAAMILFCMSNTPLDEDALETVVEHSFDSLRKFSGSLDFTKMSLIGEQLKDRLRTNRRSPIIPVFCPIVGAVDPDAVTKLTRQTDDFATWRRSVIVDAMFTRCCKMVIHAAALLIDRIMHRALLNFEAKIETDTVEANQLLTRLDNVMKIVSTKADELCHSSVIGEVKVDIPDPGEEILTRALSRHASLMSCIFANGNDNTAVRRFIDDQKDTSARFGAAVEESVALLLQRIFDHGRATAECLASSAVSAEGHAILVEMTMHYCHQVVPSGLQLFQTVTEDLAAITQATKEAGDSLRELFAHKLDAQIMCLTAASSVTVTQAMVQNEVTMFRDRVNSQVAARHAAGVAAGKASVIDKIRSHYEAKPNAIVRDGSLLITRAQVGTPLMLPQLQDRGVSSVMCKTINSASYIFWRDAIIDSLRVFTEKQRQQLPSLADLAQLSSSQPPNHNDSARLVVTASDIVAMHITDNYFKRLC